MALKYTLESVEELSEDLKQHYREENGKWFLEAEGVKPVADFEKITGALTNERKLTKEFKDKAAIWESKFTGKTPEEILAQLERIPVLEAESQGKVDQKKLGEIVETTVKQRMAPLDHEITKLRQSVVEREQEIAQFKAADRRRTIHDAVRVVAAKEGFQETAYSSADGALMLLAERYLTLNEGGDVVVSDESRLLTPGLPLREALVELGNHHPYLKKQSVGGGAAGSNGAAGGASSNPFKTNDMTARGKFMAENRKDPAKIEFMVRQAGLKNAHERHPGK